MLELIRYINLLLDLYIFILFAAAIQLARGVQRRQYPQSGGADDR